MPQEQNPTQTNTSHGGRWQKGGRVTRRGLPRNQFLVMGLSAASSSAWSRMRNGQGNPISVWPGNVRELANCMERVVVLTRGSTVELGDLPERIRNYSPQSTNCGGSQTAELIPLAEVGRRPILQVIDAVGGNKSQAAQILGLDRKTLYRRLEQYGASVR